MWYGVMKAWGTLQSSLEQHDSIGWAKIARQPSLVIDSLPTKWGPSGEWHQREIWNDDGWKMTFDPSKASQDLTASAKERLTNFYVFAKPKWLHHSMLNLSTTSFGMPLPLFCIHLSNGLPPRRRTIPSTPCTTFKALMLTWQHSITRMRLNYSY